jgi:D-aminoacyl-tRNA deacylase
VTVLIISSKIDPASTNIKKELLNLSKWVEINNFHKNKVYTNLNIKDIILITINDKKIMHENIEYEVEKKLGIKPKQAIFISRHTSKTGEPTITTHPIGNYGEAQFGGKTRTLSKSSPYFMANLLRKIKKKIEKNKLYHHVCFEVTHHGPYMEIPSLFVELGSTEEEWKKQKPAYIIAESLLELLQSNYHEKNLPINYPILIGIGGGHYAPRFTDIVFEKKVAFGHMIPTYQIKAGNIDGRAFEKALKETPNVNAVYINRKYLKKSQVKDYKEWFKNRGIPVISSKEMPDLS